MTKLMVQAGGKSMIIDIDGQPAQGLRRLILLIRLHHRFFP